MQVIYLAYSFELVVISRLSRLTNFSIFGAWARGIYALWVLFCSAKKVPKNDVHGCTSAAKRRKRESGKAARRLADLALLGFGILRRSNAYISVGVGFDSTLA